MYAALAAMVAYLIGPLGREVVIPATVLLLMESLGAGIWEAVAISVSVAFVDIFLALLVVWNFGLVSRSKRLSKIVRRMKKAFASKIGEHPSRKGYLLLAGYVAFPLQFSGGFVAAVIGSLLGFDRRRMLFAVSGGSVAGSLAVGLLAFFIGRPALDMLSLDLLQLAGILIVVGFIIAAIYLYYSYRRKRDGD